MATSARIKDTDKGYKAMVRRVFGDKPPTLEVGIFEADGAQPAEGDTDGVTVLEKAIWNEFGTTRIPERSFLRAWFDQHSERARTWIAALMPGVVTGTRTKRQVLELVGLKIVGEIQASITAEIPPPNADSTIKKKGSSTPLVDTGQLRSSISYAVKDNK